MRRRERGVDSMRLTIGTVTTEGTGPQFNSGHNAAREESVSRVRRLRGWWLRLVQKRSWGAAAGITLIAAPAALLARDYAWETGTTDGLALISLATGVALLWQSIGGRKPDWIDPDSREGSQRG